MVESGWASGERVCWNLVLVWFALPTLPTTAAARGRSLRAGLLALLEWVTSAAQPVTMHRSHAVRGALERQGFRDP